MKRTVSIMVKVGEGETVYVQGFMSLDQTVASVRPVTPEEKKILGPRLVEAPGDRQAAIVYGPMEDE